MAALGVFAIFVVFVSVLLSGTTTGVPEVPAIRAEFYLFAITLLGVALFHEFTMYVALAGLASVLAMKFMFVDEFNVVYHFEHEWPILVNLLGLLLGFAILAKHFEESKVPDILPRFLPDDWLGGFVLLVLVFILSSFLDNIAAAMIGGTVAMTVFKGKVDIGYLAAIVAASNAGGSGSVVGDTTTTMMWIAGVPPVGVVHAYAAAAPALLIFGVVCSIKQQKYQPVQKHELGHHKVVWVKLGIVAFILAGAIIANFWIGFPAAGVWVAIVVGALVSKTPWGEIQASLKGTIFLLSLVACASLMPVEELPEASWMTAFALGAISAVFDNIPLTKLAITQDGYDWGMLAYAVGFGGSMIWFGSSAGVALTNMFPHAKSVGAWIKHGWSVALAYVVGFAVLMLTLGWNPERIEELAPETNVGSVAQTQAETSNIEVPAADQPPHE